MKRPCFFPADICRAVRFALFTHNFDRKHGVFRAFIEVHS